MRLRLALLASAAAATVIITEVADKGSADTCAGQDWVELHNSGGASVALTGYKLHDDNGPDHANVLTFSGKTIGAGSYLVLCKGVDFAFGIGGDDTVTLLDAGAHVVGVGPAHGAHPQAPAVAGGAEGGREQHRLADGEEVAHLPHMEGAR